MTDFGSVFSHLRDFGIGALVAGVFLWFFPNRKEWAAARKAKRESKVDVQVMKAVSDFGLWTGPRPMTGAGVPAVRSAEVAEHLRLDNEVVADSLERLYERGRVRKEGGTLDDPSPTWHYAPR